MQVGIHFVSVKNMHIFVHVSYKHTLQFHYTAV